MSIFGSATFGGAECVASTANREKKAFRRCYTNARVRRERAGRKKLHPPDAAGVCSERNGAAATVIS